MVVETETAKIVAASLDVSAAPMQTDDTGVARVVAEVAGSPVAAAVPQSLLASLGPGVAAVFTVISDEAIQQALGDTATVDASGEPVEVTGVLMFELNSGGSTQVVEQLAEPILLTLSANATGNSVCSYWDGDKKIWSTDGVESQVNEDGLVVCAVYHLSMFGSVTGSFAKALACANLKVLTPEGLKAIGRGEWFIWPAAIALWIFSLTHLALFLMALYHDVFVRPWHGGKSGSHHFITAHPDFQKHKISTKDALHDLMESVHAVIDGIKHAANSYSPCSQFWSFVMVQFLVSSIQVSYATENRIDAYDVKKAFKKTKTVAKGMKHMDPSDSHQSGFSSKQDLVHSRTSLSMQQSMSTGSSMSGSSRLARQLSTRTTSTDAEERTRIHDLYDGLVLHIADMIEGSQSVQSYLRKTWMFFCAMQPWMSLRGYSMYVPARLRVLILCARVYGALMLSALFFTASGNSSSNDAPDFCQSDDMVEKLQMTFAISVISSLLSTLPLALMVFLRKRDIVFIGTDNVKKRRKLVRKWLFEDFLLVCIASFYIGLCFLFVMSFCANVTLTDHWNYLTSAAISMFQQLVITPLILSAFLALILTCACRSPELIKKAEKQILIRDIEQRAQAQQSSEIAAKELPMETLEDNLEEDDNRVVPDNRIMPFTPTATTGYRADTRVMPGSSSTPTTSYVLEFMPKHQRHPVTLPFSDQRSNSLFDVNFEPASASRNVASRALTCSEPDPEPGRGEQFDSGQLLHGSSNSAASSSAGSASGQFAIQFASNQRYGSPRDIAGGSRSASSHSDPSDINLKFSRSELPSGFGTSSATPQSNDASDVALSIDIDALLARRASASGPQLVSHAASAVSNRAQEDAVSMRLADNGEVVKLKLKGAALSRATSGSI